MGSLQSSKSVRSVTSHERRGSSRAEMGENRTSSKADVRAYSESAVERGRALKVPMQPRRDVPRDEVLFQVTKSGDSVILAER